MNHILTGQEFQEAKDEIELNRQKAANTGMKHHADFKLIEQGMENIWTQMVDVGKKLNLVQISETASTKQFSTIIAVCGARIFI